MDRMKFRRWNSLLANLGLPSCWSKKLGLKFCFIYSYFFNLLMGGKGLGTVYCHLPIPIPYILHINLILSMSLVLKPHLHCPLVSPLPLYLVNLIFWHLYLFVHFSFGNKTSPVGWRQVQSCQELIFGVTLSVFNLDTHLTCTVGTYLQTQTRSPWMTPWSIFPWTIWIRVFLEFVNSAFNYVWKGPCLVSIPPWRSLPSKVPVGCPLSLLSLITQLKKILL